MQIKKVNILAGTTENYAKQNKSVGERQIPYDFTNIWNLRNKTDEHRGIKKKRGQTIKDFFFFLHKRLLTEENKLRVVGGEVSGGWALSDGY